MSSVHRDQFLNRLATGSRSEAWDLLQHTTHTPPRFFYKYLARGSKSIRSVIVDSQLWLASPGLLNDPFEMALHVTFKGTPSQKLSALKAMAKSTGVPWKARQEFAKLAFQDRRFELMSQTHRQLVDQFGVTCLTSAGARNLLMWSHYADSHKGLCFQFHLPSTPIELLTAFPVNYSDSYPIINWVKRDKVESKLGDVLYQKSNAWSYEREYRIVERERANTAYQLKPRGVSAVILGVKASDDLADEVAELIRERISSGSPKIKVFRAKLANTRYHLVVERATDLESKCYG